eukprot:TRINITY_DN10165_c0_g1_i5.p1 TRINITY_DN10165_c0_g1~~TRINITY_DN10165_c0_g1_i5.p1  ORF type:complete len:112 (-),score=14.20 TRINITY_DN10165_c0_g1_i5:361-696(-)
MCLPSVTITKHSQPKSPSSDRLERLLTKIRNHIKTHNVLAKPYFQDYDRHNRSVVTNTQFAAALTFLNIPGVKDVDIKFLQDMYMSPDVKNHVNYSLFVKEVDPNPLCYRE